MHAPPRPRPTRDKHGNLIPTRRSVASRIREKDPTVSANDDAVFRAAQAVHRRLREQAQKRS